MNWGWNLYMCIVLIHSIIPWSTNWREGPTNDGRPKGIVIDRETIRKMSITQVGGEPLFSGISVMNSRSLNRQNWVDSNGPTTKEHVWWSCPLFHQYPIVWLMSLPWYTAPIAPQYEAKKGIYFMVHVVLVGAKQEERDTVSTTRSDDILYNPVISSVSISKMAELMKRRRLATQILKTVHLISSRLWQKKLSWNRPTLKWYLCVTISTLRRLLEIFNGWYSGTSEWLE